MDFWFQFLDIHVNEQTRICHESTIYYLQDNGQLESTNRIIRKIRAKLVSANWENWDLILLTTLWAY